MSKSIKKEVLICGVAAAAVYGSLYTYFYHDTDMGIVNFYSETKAPKMPVDLSTDAVSEYKKNKKEFDADMKLVKILSTGTNVLMFKLEKDDVEKITKSGIALNANRIKMVVGAYLRGGLSDDALNSVLDTVQDKKLLIPASEMVNDLYKKNKGLTQIDWRKRLMKASDIINNNLTVPTSMLKDRDFKGMYDIAQAAISMGKINTRV